MSEVIENKVVSISFDNSRFERNVEKTIKSIDGLNSTLTKIDGKKFANDLNQNINKVDFTPMEKGADGVKNKFSAMQVAGVTAVATLTHKVMGFFGKVEKNTLGQIRSGGIARALNIEQAKFQMEGLGKSWKSVYKDIDFAVKGTAYGLDEAATVASQLLASQVKAGDEMKTSLRAVSGMAAMSGRSYGEVGRIFTKVAGNGRLMSQELLQFSASGLNAAATLKDFLNKNEDVRKAVIQTGLTSKKSAKAVSEFANSTKLTEQNVRTLVSSGAIDFKTFSRAMDDAFGAHAKAANKTFKGALSNMKAALSRIGADFAGDMLGNGGGLDNARRLIIALTDVIDKFRAQIKPIAESVNALATTITKKLVKALNALRDGMDLGPISKNVSGFLDNITHKLGGKVKHDVEKTGKTVSKTVKTSTKGLKDQNKKLKDLDKIAKRVIRGDFGNGIERYKKLKKSGYDFVAVQELVNTKLLGANHATSKLAKALGLYDDKSKKAKKSTESNADVIKKYKKVADEVIRGTYGNGIERQKALTKAGYDYYTVQSIVNHKLLGTKMDLSKLTKEQDKNTKSLDKNKKSLDKNKKILTQVKDAAKDPTVLGNIGATLKNSASILYNILKPLKDAFLETFDMKSAGSGIRKGLLGLTGIIAKATSKINKFLEKNSDKIKRTFKGVFSIFSIIGSVIKIIISPLKTLFSVISKNSVKTDRNILDITASIGDFIVKIDKTIKSSKNIKKVLSYIDKGIIKIANAIKNLKKYFSVKGLDSIKTKLSKLPGIIKNINLDSIKNKLSKLSGIIKNINLDSIKTKLSKLPEKFNSIGGLSADGFKEGFVKGFIKIKNVLTRIFSKLIESVKKVLGIKSPSRIFMMIAQYCLEGFIKGFNKDSGKVIGVIKGLFGKISSSIKGMFSSKSKSKTGDQIIDEDDLSEKEVTFGQFLTNIKNAIKNFIESISGMHIDLGDLLGIVSIIGSFVLVYKIVNKLTGTMNGLVKALTEGPITKLTKSVSGTFDALTGTLKDYQKNMKANRILKIAAAIALLAGSIALLAYLPAHKVGIAATVLAGLAIVLAIVVKQMSALSDIQAAKISGVILSFSSSLLIMVAALKMLNNIQLDPDKYGETIGKVAAIVVLIGSLVAALVLLSKFGKSATVVTTGTALSISIMLLALVKAFDNLNDLVLDIDFEKKLDLLVETLGKLFLGLMLITKVKGVGVNVLLITASLFLLISLLKTISKINYDEKTTDNIYENLKMLFIPLIGIFALVKIFGKDAKRIGASILAISASLLLLVVVIKVISSIKPKALAKGITVMTVLAGIMAALMYVSKYATGDSKAIIASMLGFVAAMFIISMVVTIIGNMNPSTLKRGVTTISILGLVLAAVVKASNNASKISVQSLAVSVVAIAVLAVIAYVLGGMNPSEVFTGINAVSAIVGLTIALIKFSDKSKKINIKSLYACVGAIFILAGIVSVLSLLKPANVIVGTACVSALVGMVILLNKFATKSRSIKIKSLYACIGAIFILAGIVSVLSLLKPANVIVGTACVSALVGMVILLNKFATQSKSIDTLSIIGLAIAVAILSIPVYLLGQLNPESVKTGTLAIIALVACVAALMVLSSSVGNLSLAPFLMMIGLVVVIGVVIYALSNLGVDKVVPVLASLSIFIVALTLALIGLAVVGSFAAPAIIGIGVLVVFVAALTGLMALLGALADDVGPLIEKGGPILVSVGKFLGDFIGSIISGIGKGISKAIIDIGTSLAYFGACLPVFSAGIKTVPDNIENVMLGLAAGIAAICGGDLWKSIQEFFLGDPIEDFCDGLILLAEGLAAFAGVISKSEVNLDNIDVIASSILSLAQAQSLASDIDGVEAAENLSSFAKNIQGAFTELSKIEITQDVVSKMELIEKALDPFISIAQKLSSINDGSGGSLFSWVFGKNLNLKKFGTQLKSFGESLVLFSGSVSSLSKKDTKKIELVAELMDPFVKMAKKLSEMNDGGDDSAWAHIAGSKMNFSKLGVNLENLGTSLVKFSYSLESLSKKDTKKIELVAELMDPFVKLAKKLSEVKDGDAQSGWSILTGEGMSLSKLGTNLESLGFSLVSFSSSISSLSSKDVTQMENIPPMLDSFVEICEKLSGLEGNDESWMDVIWGKDATLVDLGDGMKALGNGLKAFSGIEKIKISKKSTDSIKKSILNIKDMFVNIKGEISTNDVFESVKSVKQLGSAIQQISKGINEFVTAINNTKKYTEKDTTKFEQTLTTIAKTSISKFTNQFKSTKKKTDVTTAVKDFIKKIKISSETSNGLVTNYFTVGQMTVQGYLDGLNDMAGKVEGTLEAIFKSGIEVSMKTLDEHSPSKVFKKIGKFTIQGYIDGVENNRVKAIKATKNTFSAIIKAAKKEMIAGGSQLKSFVKQFFPDYSSYSSKKLKKTITKSSKALSDAAYGLYKKSDAYKEDSATQKSLKKDLKKQNDYIKKHENKVSKKSLDTLEKEYKKKKKRRIAAEKADEKHSTKRSKATLKRAKKYEEIYEKRYKKKKKLQQAKEKRKQDKADLKALNKQVEENIKNTWNDFVTNIKDNVADFVNPFSIALDLGVNLLQKFDRQTRISSKRFLYNMKSNVKAVEEYNTLLAAAEKKGLEKEFLNDIKDMGIEGMEYLRAIVNMTEDDVLEANALYYTNQEQLLDKWIRDMKDKATKAEQWQQKLNDLASMKYSKDVIKEITSMGIEEGMAYIDTLLIADDSKIADINATVARNLSMPAGISKKVSNTYAATASGIITTLSKTLNEDATVPDAANKLGTKILGKLQNYLSSKEGESLSKQTLAGIEKGIKDAEKTKKIKALYKALGYSTINAFKKALGIKSPSREFISAAGYTIAGLVEGVDKNKNRVESAYRALGEVAIKSANSIMEDSINAPVITPVVDLSEVENSADGIGSMFDSAVVMNTSSSFANGQNQKNNLPTQIVNNYNNEFNQNNYSPDPLDRTAIYRDTKSLIGRNWKGELVTS